MKTPVTQRSASKSNLSSEKLLVLLELLSEQKAPLRLQDIAALADMNVSTTLRFLSTLESKGYVVQDENTLRYSLTLKLCQLAHNITTQIDLRSISTPFLRSVSQIFGESVNLVVEYEMSVMYLEVVNGPRQMLMTLQRIGGIAPMHCTGSGKLLLLNYSEQQLETLAAVKSFVKFTDNTITSLDKLKEELALIRKRGYAYDMEECEQGARCIAVPVYDYSGKVAACISVSGPSVRMTMEYMHEKLPFLLDAAASISFRLGYTQA